MAHLSARLCLPLCLGLLAALARPAYADAIDGQWCDEGKKHLEINGPSIVTPAGARLTGDYDRHGFRHADPATGQPVVMVLMGETRMSLRMGGGPEELWRRCAAPTS